MSFSSFPAAARFSRGLCAIACGLVAAACGGGGEDPTMSMAGSSAQATTPGAPTAAAAQKAAPSVSVFVEGCVLDRFYIPTTGTPVRALAADGRLLGGALSDGQGRFTLRLPARSEVTLQIDRPQGESLPVRVDADSSKSGACLLDERA
jgi:hypothetical protein